MGTLGRTAALALIALTVAATVVTVASAQDLIGTYTIDYYHNAGGCINGNPNVDVPTAGNPFYCSYIPPGPLVIPADPGRYRVTVVGFGPVAYSGAIWNGDASGGSHIYMPATLGGSLDFDHTGADMVFYYWDWYPYDNSPAYSVTFQLFSLNSAPAAPTNLGAKQISFSSNGVQLNWDYGSDQVDSFSVERIPASANNDWSQAVITSVPSLTACPLPAVGGTLNCSYPDLDAAVSNLATFSYRVRAYQGSTPSDYSNTTTAYQLKLVSPTGILTGTWFGSPYIFVDFIPDPSVTAISSAASELGFQHFNWISINVEQPNCYFSSPLHSWRVPVVGTPQQGPAVVPPSVDPPRGGYYEYGQYWSNGILYAPVGCPNKHLHPGDICDGPMDELDYYWNENPTNIIPQPWYLDPLYGLNPDYDLSTYVDRRYVDGKKVGSLTFGDKPANSCISDSIPFEYMGFDTFLVGITTQPPTFTPLATFSWASNYDGFMAGSITGVTLSSVGPTAVEGTGGIFNVAPVALGDVPVPIRQMLIQLGAKGVTTAPNVDQDAPMTAAFLSGQQGTNGSYTGPVTVTLIATDIDGPSDIASTSYNIDGGSTNAYTTPFTVSVDGIHTIEFGSVDKAGNVETPRPSQTIEIDATPPVITVSANPSMLWPPNGKMVNVTVSGTVTDATSGVNGNSAKFAVADKYGSVQPSGLVTLGANGAFSFTIALQASRLGADNNGRTYTITVTAQDNVGNQSSGSAIVMVPHDQGH